MPPVIRDNYSFLLDIFLNRPSYGVILSGIVGCGKTFLVNQLCPEFERMGYTVMRFEGDDVKFRSLVKSDTYFFIDQIKSQGALRPLIVIDEAQKEAEIFDALKLAFDKADALFLVTGSNPRFLQVEAQHRLQRRGRIVPMLPFSIAELVKHHEPSLRKFDGQFESILTDKKALAELRLEKIKKPGEVDHIVCEYLKFGGLPAVQNTVKSPEKMLIVKLVAERGITDTYIKTQAVTDEVRRYLAMNNSQEFTYQGLHQVIRSTKRREVDDIVDHLLNFGYILKKRPFLGEFELTKKTYFAVYSWIDPGFVSYFTGDLDANDQNDGFRLEASIHAKLFQILENLSFSAGVFYYKPYTQKESTGDLVFLKGEIDFIIRIGSKIIPIEVKMGTNIRNFQLDTIKDFVTANKLEFGIVLYGGSPFIDEESKLIYYPYWMI